MKILKELFNTEDGKITFEQLESGIKEKGYKLADLSSGDYVSKNKHEDIVKSLNSQIGTLTENINTRDKDLETLKLKLKDVGEDTSKLDEVTQQFTDLQTKYDTDIAEYKNRLSKQEYEFAVKEFANTKDFTSNAAKRDFINSMLGEKLKIKDGSILGAEDFVNVYTKDNADAFKQSIDNSTKGPEVQQPKPKFTTTIEEDKTEGGGANDLLKAFNFRGL